jgi:hypothetical protein
MAEATADEVVPLVFKPNRILPKVDTRTTFQRNFTVCLILLSAGFERLAFYSLAGNLTYFLDSTLIKWRFPNTIIAPLIFLGKPIKYISTEIDFVLYFKRYELHFSISIFLGE